jgi:hypothetical protein
MGTDDTARAVTGIRMTKARIVGVFVSHPLTVRVLFAFSIDLMISLAGPGHHLWCIPNIHDVHDAAG